MEYLNNMARSGPTDTHWVTYEGVSLTPKEMDTNHLVNTIKYVRRQHNGIPPHLAVIVSKMKTELDSRSINKRAVKTEFVSADDMNVFYSIHKDTITESDYDKMKRLWVEKKKRLYKEELRRVKSNF